MKEPMKAWLMPLLALMISTLIACGGGGGSSNDSDGDTNDGDGDGGTTTPQEPAERFVISGNNDGTLSIFRSNELTGYATAQAYFPTDGFAIRDIAYDQGNSRIILISVNTIYVLDIDVESGNLTQIDNRPTSGNSSHLALNSDASAVYVASGTSSGQAVDMFAIGNSGTLSPATSTTLSIDPDYIKLDPAETYLYVVSRENAQILIYSINGDNTLAGGPATVPTDTSPTSLGFNSTGTRAYLSRQNNSDNLVVYDVASDGSLTQSTTFSNSNSPLDMVLNADGSQLYVLDSSNKNINRYSVDNSGALTFVDSTDVSFTATDITLSHTGEQLYVGHSEDDLVSTIDIDANDGSLTIAGWVRAFSSANTVAAVGADGAIRPTATYLLAPDLAGLSVFSTDADGALTQVATLNSSGALIDGEVAVDYANGLLLGTGEDASASDILSSFAFDPLTATVTAVDTIDATVSTASEFTRIELDRSGRVLYAMDKGVDFTDTAYVRVYSYDSNGSINSTPFDSVNDGLASPENMRLNPAGSYLYIVRSYADTIGLHRVEQSDAGLATTATVTPGGTGADAGRPIDISFHPNGRYAYVSLEDDDEIVRYEVDTNGNLNNPNRTGRPANTGPGALAIHPNGRFLYNAENTQDDISTYTISTNNYSLTHQSSVSASGKPSWLEIDPRGQFLYVRFRDETIQVFSIDATTGDLTDTGQVVSAGSSGGFLPTMTLIAPLQ